MNNKELEEEVSMKYFEINNPYFAMIGAENEQEALSIYVEVVSDANETLKDEIEELERDYALVQFARSRSEDGKLLPYKELMEEFKGKGVLLIDSSL